MRTPMGQCPCIPLGYCGSLDPMLIWECPLFSMLTYGNPIHYSHFSLTFSRKIYYLSNKAIIEISNFEDILCVVVRNLGSPLKIGDAWYFKGQKAPEMYGEMFWLRIIVISQEIEGPEAISRDLLAGHSSYQTKQSSKCLISRICFVW